MKKIKKKLILLLLLLAFNMNFIFSKTITFNEALLSKKIQYTAHGNSNSTHYLEPIILEIANNSNEIFYINIENGDQFFPTDTNKQNIVITEQKLIVLQPKEKQSIKLKGMCTEQNNASGNDETVYTFNAKKNEQLTKLANYISTKKYQTSAAQYAVWSLMNNSDINAIYAADSTEENDLKKFMASLTGKTFAVKMKDYKYNYYTPPREKVGGNFEYSFSKAQDIQIAMFDENGILIRELFNQKKVPAGAHKISFEYDSSVYTDAIYYFKLIVGNEVMVNRKWNAQAMRDSFKNKIENGQ